MSCPSNVQSKSFLFWKWKEEGRHNHKITCISRFMYCSTDFTVDYRCNLCGTRTHRSFVEMEELILEGFTPKQLDKIDSRNPLYLN